jgi:hypothetical protein
MCPAHDFGESAWAAAGPPGMRRDDALRGALQARFSSVNSGRTKPATVPFAFLMGGSM